MSVLGIVDNRIGRLEKTQRKNRALASNNRAYEFLVAPSCRPDKQVHIRGGIVNPSGTWGFIINDDFIPNWTCDFENENETQLSLNFSNANYYLGLILCYYGEWAAYRTVNPPTYEEPVFDCVVGTEVATAAGAEAEIDGLLNGSTDWYYYRMPLWGIVLKNDGRTGIDYAILPVDATNRGRSYLYRDARSRGGLYP